MGVTNGSLVRMIISSYGSFTICDSQHVILNPSGRASLSKLQYELRLGLSLRSKKQKKFQVMMFNIKQVS